MRNVKKPVWQKGIAKERIEILFSLAGKEFITHPERSHRYVELARRIGKRYNIKMNKLYKQRFCKKCLHYLRQGSNSRVRASRGVVVVTCLDCGHVSRHPYQEKGGI